MHQKRSNPTEVVERIGLGRTPTERNEADRSTTDVIDKLDQDAVIAASYHVQATMPERKDK